MSGHGSPVQTAPGLARPAQTRSSPTELQTCGLCSCLSAAARKGPTSPGAALRRQLAAARPVMRWTGSTWAAAGAGGWLLVVCTGVCAAGAGADCCTCCGRSACSTSWPCTFNILAASVKEATDIRAVAAARHAASHSRPKSHRFWPDDCTQARTQQACQNIHTVFKSGLNCLHLPAHLCV